MADTTPTLREAAQQFVQDYENGDLGDLKHYARSMRAALAEQAADGWCDIGQANKKLRRLLTTAPAAEQAEPVVGFRLLPSRLTNEMRAAMADAARAYMARTGGNSADAMYDAAVAAAPPAPAPTWPEWAEQILKIVREYSGYDGYDDADGVDLPEEVREALEELTAQITRLEAKAPAPAADAMPAGWREVIADVAADISDHPSLACEKLRRLLAAPPAPAAAPAGEPAACISRTQGRIYAQLLPAGRSLPLGTNLYPQQSAAMFQPAPARQEPLTDAARDVLAERQRQVSAEGWAPEHDDEHGDGSMSIAAACYALEGTGPEQLGIVSLEHLWHSSGWDSAWWKPKGRRRNLVKAAALMLAEIERLDRAAPITAAPAEGGA